MAAGFEQMYRFLQARRAELLGPQGPLRNWSGLRFVFRATRYTVRCSSACILPAASAMAWTRASNWSCFTRPLLYAQERPSSWPILADERRSLLQGDIPMFQYAAEGDGLILEGGGLVPQFFRDPGFLRSKGVSEH